MTLWIDRLNSISAMWAEWIWRACWQGAVVVLAAWLLTMVFGHSSPRLRCWIWRLAYLKLLILLVCATPVELALLPADEFSSNLPAVAELPANTVSNIESRRVSMASEFPPAKSHEIPKALRSTADSIEPILGAVPSAAVSPTAGSQKVAVSRPTWSTYLMSIWLIGLARCVVRLAQEVLFAIRLCRTATPRTGPQTGALIREVVQRFGRQVSVRAAESPLATGPLLVKFRTPIVVFPTGFADSLSREELRSVLAHEVAHLVRRDLGWNALSASIHCLLYFHPLIWLAHHRSRQEQEMACDELAITRLAVECHDYASMLVKVVEQLSRPRQSQIAIVAVASSYRSLSRRLLAMNRIRALSRGETVLAALTMCLIIVGLIIPWRVVPQEAKPTPPAGNKKAVDHPPNSQLGHANDDPASAKLRNLLVGAWQEGLTDDRMVFHDDGTYERFSHRLTPSSGARRGGNRGAVVSAETVNNANVFQNRSNRGSFSQLPRVTVYQDIYEKGTWKLQQVKSEQDPNGMQDAIGLTPQFEFNALPLWWQSNPEIGLERQTQEKLYRIERLDDSLLRVRFTPPPSDTTQPPSRPGFAADERGTVFYSRVRPTELDAPSLAALPQEARRFAQLAQLTPDELKRLAESLESNALSVKTESLKALDRAIAARYHEIGFAELFDLSNEEVAAYRDLMRLLDRDYDAAVTYVNGAGTLSPVEVSAVKKLMAFRKDFDDNYRWIDFARFGKNILEPSGQVHPDPAEADIRKKLTSRMTNLEHWLDATVYQYGSRSVRTQASDGNSPSDADPSAKNNP